MHVRAHTPTLSFTHRYIEQLNRELQAQQSDGRFRQCAYVTHEDIRSIANFKDQTLIAIKAPSGATLAVPYPDHARDAGQARYHIYLQSQQGPVDIYLVSSQGDSDDEPGLGRLPNDRHDGDAEAGEGFLHLSPRSECGSVLNLDAMEGDGGGTGFCDYYAYDGEGPL
jgi:hypothetical protein